MTVELDPILLRAAIAAVQNMPYDPSATSADGMRLAIREYLTRFSESPREQKKRQVALAAIRSWKSGDLAEVTEAVEAYLADVVGEVL